MASVPAMPIGGFFEFHVPDGVAAERSLLGAWTAGSPHAAFVNARSAFATLVAQWPDATVWLPAFLCRDLLQEAYRHRIAFFGVDEGFEPDLRRLETARAGDVVLFPAYFGMPPGKRVLDFQRRRDDLRFVEDRAQALDTGAKSAAGWHLYSPRKLLGVADGGLLVARRDVGNLPRPTIRPDAPALWRAPLSRFEDPGGVANEVWHAANQEKERGMSAEPARMTRLSLSILSRTSPESLASQRLVNWRRLDSRLREWSALPRDASPAPFGYVLRLPPERRDTLLKALHADRIFAAVHWKEIAGPAEDFPREARLARELLTLPCDHRYGNPDMDRVAARVEECLG